MATALALVAFVVQVALVPVIWRYLPDGPIVRRGLHAPGERDSR